MLQNKMDLQLIRKPSKVWRNLGAVIMSVVLSLTACSSAAPTVPSEAIISAPDASTVLVAGKAAQITGKINGSAVKSVDVFVNGNKYATVNQPVSANEYQVSVAWTPEKGGIQIVQLKGLNDKGEQVVQASVIVNAQATGAPVAVAAATTVAPQVVATSVPIGAAAPTTAPILTVAKPQANEVSVINDFANIRSGPGVGYDRVGKLDQKAIASVLGKNNDTTWWQIQFKDAPNGLGWISADLVKFSGDATAIKVPVIPTPPPAPTAAPTRIGAALPPAPPPAPAQPTSPPLPPAPVVVLQPSALLPYSQNMTFDPRNDIGDVPLGYSEGKTSTLVWEVNGAKSLELEITSFDGPGIFSECKAGDLSKIQPATAVNRRMPLQVPSGKFSFSAEDGKGYYLFTIHVVKSDGSTTTIPRNVIIGCYKK